FPFTDPIGKEITIDNYRFEVVGVLEAKGAVLGQSQDKEVYIPLPVYVKGFANDSHFSATITVKASDAESFATVFDEAIGIMRSIRNVAPGAENDFEIEDNSTIKEQFESFVNFIGYFAAIVAGFSLLAAGIGIMNIMLISVKERTREIGIRKALGATNKAVLTQFLIEAVTVCQLGGVIGIMLAVSGSVALSTLTDTTLSLPYLWIIGSVSICIIIGIVFGLYPAYKAANLDPIDALRYE
ncbi:MAG: FtsX-like permease family protein, partial [Candidatus Kapabacteria bacterium]|nr:FtsX-like permease family protein [Candidatus Kapabacteria bacterium]